MQLTTSSEQAKTITLAEYADFVEQSTCVRAMDLGPAVLLFVEHPEKGSAILANTVEGTCCVIPSTQR